MIDIIFCTIIGWMLVPVLSYFCFCASSGYNSNRIDNSIKKLSILENIYSKRLECRTVNCVIKLKLFHNWGKFYKWLCLQ